MAGGTWSTQNKVRPGVYIRFKAVGEQGLTVGERGIVAICEPLSWGPIGTINTIVAGDDPTPYTGYDLTNSNNRFLQEIFKGSNRTTGANTVLLYRPAAAGSAAATATIGNLTATAYYAGARGNDITITSTEQVGNAGTYTVDTVVDGLVVDSQSGQKVGDLVDNAWVKFTGTSTASLSSTTGTALTGGLDGTVATSAYASWITALEPYKFDILIYDGSDGSTQTALKNFVERLANDTGAYSQMVTSGMTAPDSRFVINVLNGVKMDDGTSLTAAQACWWVGGVEAGAAYNESLTYATYPGAVDIPTPLTNAQYEAAINGGQIAFFAEDGAVKIEQDINSLTTFTADIGKVFSKNRIMRLCNTIANDIYAQFSNNYIGIVNNDETGRMRFKSAIVGYLLDIQGNQGIQNFTADDVTVEPGDTIDAILVNVALQVVDSVEKIYMTVEVQ